jgi:hypothetical protein
MEWRTPLLRKRWMKKFKYGKKQFSHDMKSVENGDENSD